MCGQHGCICAGGWTHISEKSVCDIDIDECQQGDLCSDKGICNNTEGSYACVCLSGWGGANCSTYNCTVRACKNGGTCVDGRCICTKNWTGNDCSSYVPTDTDSLVPGIADRMLLYGSCGLLMFLIILLLVSVWCACKNKKQRTISPNRTMWTMDQNGRFQRKLYSNKTPSGYGDLPYL
ncbi:neurogenic locus notch homolog protein 2-like [Mya arenaria]|uniref:neurogenic locus notch homolog protein 2-like n=1 Tax=Mya arenaria TaxID=6604 RepID=UPI0022E211C1|nr:neurogenic locus notch homolog protein 2-like [Mya arenaria]